MTITEEDGALHFKQVEETREANANVGTMRALVADMVKGCSVGFQKKLQLVGVGYRAQAQGDKLNLSSASPTRSSIRCPLVSSAKRRARLKF